MKVAFYTLGCKVNQNETGALEQLFCDNGFSLAAPDEEADVYIVNSCILKVAFYTLGCKVNQNETGALEQLFCDNGFSLAAPDEEADVYIVNSCTVTSGGDKKSRQWLRRAKRQNPDAITVLTGCYPQAFPDEAALATEADVITGSKNRARLLNDVLTFLQQRERIVDIAPHEKKEKNCLKNSLWRL